MSEFDGFPAGGLAFLTMLGEQNKAWFDENRETYDTEVVPPAKDFVEAMGESLAAAISPDIVAQPRTNGSIAPINNDIRFNPKASPYKDHLMFRFWEGPNKKVAPTLWVRLHPEDGVGFASGVAIAAVEAWRRAVDERGEPLASELATLVAKHDAEVVGADLKRVPKPYAEDHPRADLLRHKGFQVRYVEPVPASVGSARFVDWCTARLVRLEGVHRWLVDEL